MQRFHKHSRTCPSEDVGSQPCPSSTDEMRCVESFHRSVAFPRDICIQTGGQVHERMNVKNQSINAEKARQRKWSKENDASCVH